MCAFGVRAVGECEVLHVLFYRSELGCWEKGLGIGKREHGGGGKVCEEFVGRHYWVGIVRLSFGVVKGWGDLGFCDGQRKRNLEGFGAR